LLPLTQSSLLAASTGELELAAIARALAPADADAPGCLAAVDEFGSSLDAPTAAAAAAGIAAFVASKLHFKVRHDILLPPLLFSAAATTNLQQKEEGQRGQPRAAAASYLLMASFVSAPQLLVASVHSSAVLALRPDWQYDVPFKRLDTFLLDNDASFPAVAGENRPESAAAGAATAEEAAAGSPPQPGNEPLLAAAAAAAAAAPPAAAAAAADSLFTRLIINGTLAKCRGSAGGGKAMWNILKARGDAHPKSSLASPTPPYHHACSSRPLKPVFICLKPVAPPCCSPAAVR
jgi:hypothetical protein